MPIIIKLKDLSGKLGAEASQPSKKPGKVIKFDVSDLPVNLTEDDVAEDFAVCYVDKLRFDHTIKKWLEWNGACWSVNETGLAFDYSRRLCRKHRRAETKMASKKAAEGVEHMASRDPRLAVKSDIWDQAPLLLGTPGGTVNLKDGLLREADPQDFITKLVAVTPAPKGATCPVFQKFLEEATGGDKELQTFLQQWAGYCLTGLTTEQALLFIYGPGGNGKSLLLKVLSGIMGDYAKNAAPGTFAATLHRRHLTELAMLQGARLVTTSETETGQKWSEVRVNELTGGDPITANFMRGDHFTYQPKFKIMIAGNHKPGLSTVNDAARRRFNIVPFMHKPKKPDPALAAKLQEEYPAILRWAIEGCIDWQQKGLVRPSVVNAATAEYFDEQDLFGRWIEEKCSVGLGQKGSPTKLYESWKQFALANGEEPGTATMFGTRLPERGYIKKKSGTTNYLGIAVKSELPDLSNQI
jgi:putative DNA primase/helicase